MANRENTRDALQCMVCSRRAGRAKPAMAVKCCPNVAQPCAAGRSRSFPAQKLAP